MIAPCVRRIQNMHPLVMACIHDIILRSENELNEILNIALHL